MSVSPSRKPHHADPAAAGLAGGQMRPVAWTPQVVEDLLYRQFMHGDDVTASIPRRPQPLEARSANTQNQQPGVQKGLSNVCFSDATRAMCKYLGAGPAVALSGGKGLTLTSPPNGGYSGSPTPTHRNNNNNNNINNSAPPPGAAGANAASPRSPAARVQAGAKLQRPQETSLPPPPAAHDQHQSQPSSPAATAAAVKTYSAQAPSNRPSPPAATQQQPQQQQMQPHPRGNECVQQCKRVRVEWPAGVPTNKDLATGKTRPERHLVCGRIKAQERVDPDLIFRQPPEDFPLHTIFNGFPAALEKLDKARGLSGDWHTDTFTKREEDDYKKSSGFAVIGASQVNSSPAQTF